MSGEYAALIGARIAEARKTAGLSQRALAEQLPGAIDNTQVSGWERGKHRISDETLVQVATVLKREVAWFYAHPSGEGLESYDERILRRIEELSQEIVGIRRQLDLVVAALIGAEDPEGLREQVMRVIGDALVRGSSEGHPLSNSGAVVPQVPRPRPQHAA